ncbi:unnamed protein product [Caenorhabditis brenneri]
MSDRWTTNPECIDLLNFLIEKTKNVESTMNMKQLATEFKEKTEAPRSISGITHRIVNLLSKIHKMEHIETDAKVKLLFALKAPVDSDFLETLETEAIIVLDDHQKIIEYTKKGGGLELKSTDTESQQTFSRNMRFKVKAAEISDDDDEEREGQNIKPVITKSGRVSKRRINYGEIDIDDNESLPDRKRKKDTSSSSERIKTVDSKRGLKPSVEILETLTDTEMTDPTEDIKPETTHTSRFEFLDALKSLILFLDLPSLSQIKSIIHQKMIGSGAFKLIPNNEILVAMEMCMVKMSNQYSVATLLNTDEFCSLRDFFCYLKAVILSSKFDGLEPFLTKLKANIQHLYLHDKIIPVSKVESVLGAMLDFIDI